MLILYDNLFAKSALAGYALSASGSANGFSMANIADWLDYDFWKADASGVSYVEVDFTAAQSADTLAIYAHEMFTNGGSVKVKRYDGGAWTQVGATLTPASNGLQIIRFTPVADTRWRIEVTSTPASKIGIGFLGAALILPAPLVGFEPPLVQGIEAVINRSAGGTLLGISGKPKAADVSVSFKPQTPAWVRSDWVPFMNHAARRAFIFVPDETVLSEAWWCWCEKPLPQPSYNDTELMRAELVCKATDGL